MGWDKFGPVRGNVGAVNSDTYLKVVSARFPSSSKLYYCLVPDEWGIKVGDKIRRFNWYDWATVEQIDPVVPHSHPQRKPLRVAQYYRREQAEPKKATITFVREALHYGDHAERITLDIAPGSTVVVKGAGAVGVHPS